MLIDCPSCTKSYHISRATLGPQGRKVICPHCLESWFATPSARTADDEDPDIAPEGFADAELPDINAEVISERTRQLSYEEIYGAKATAQPPVSAARRKLRLPRAVIFVPAFLGLTMGVIACHASIVKLWPQASEIYAAAGLDINERGLDLQHVHVNLVRDGAQPVLVVDGEIINRHAEKAQVPELRLAVLDDHGHEIYTWDTASPKAKLDGGETIAFRARLAAPPPEGRDVFVRFAAAAPKAASKNTH